VQCQSATNFLVPAIGVTGVPQLGTTYQPSVLNAPPSTFAVLASGLSDQTSQGQPLPLPLPGAPGCDLLVAADVLEVAITNIAGFTQSPIAVPNQPALAGAELFHQWFVLDQAANAIGVVASNAGRALIRN
jgi:hypothetical protein